MSRKDYLYDDTDPENYLEICCFDTETAQIAVALRPTRIELCADRAVGGITPALEDVKKVREAIEENGGEVLLNVMIRPRSGDFVYTDVEFEEMKRSMDEARDLVDGFVFGILDTDGKVDVQRNKALIRHARDLPCTFHRAFDEVVIKHGKEAIFDVARCGFEFLLTAGGEGNAEDNLETLSDLVDLGTNQCAWHHDNPVEIMPGGGVWDDNLGKIAVETTASWFHSSGLRRDGVPAFVTRDRSYMRQITNMKAILLIE